MARRVYNDSDYQNGVVKGGAYEMVVAGDSVPAGWITGFGIRGKRQESENENASLSFVLYQGGGDFKFVWDSVAQEWGPSYAMRETRFTRRWEGYFYWGITINRGAASFWVDDLPTSSIHDMYYYSISRKVDLNGVTHLVKHRTFNGFVEYQPNTAPGVGAWDSPTPSGEITNSQPTLAGTLPHSNGDGAYDETASVHLRVRDTISGNYLYDAAFAPTNTEKANNRFSRSPVTLTAGRSYTAEFRHQDSWGVWSGWSPLRSFAMVQGPHAPTISSPVGKINVLGGYEIRGRYTHPQGDAGTALQLQLFNASGTTQIGTTDTYTVALSNGGSWSRIEQFLDLVTNTSYAIRARAQANTIWGPWSEFTSIQTNAPPTAPSFLSPADERPTGTGLFSMRVADPDGDRVTAAEMELYRISTNAKVGATNAMTVTADGKTANLQLVLSTFVEGETYRWRGRAFDGKDWGPWSGFAYFKFADVPEVSVLTPHPRINDISVPSPNPEVEVPYWEQTALVEGVDFVEETVDPNAITGAYVWRGTASSTNANTYREADARTVDPTRPRHVGVMMMALSGVSVTHLNVLCYDASDNLIGTVSPNSTRAAQGVALTEAWLEYGGIVWPAGSPNTPAWPAGTANARVEIEYSRAAQAEVLWDAVISEALPALTLEQYQAAQYWYGYADGSMRGYGAEPYAWQDVVGRSPSLIPPILVDQPVSVVISHDAVKNADILYVEEWDGFEWGRVLDTGWITSARTTVPLPAGILRNEGRWRVQVGVRELQSGLNVDGFSQWVELDTRFAGPVAIPPYVIDGDPTRGEVSLTFPQPTLNEAEFAGIEILRKPVGGKEITIALVLDQNASSFTDPYPVSGVEYDYTVRQLKNQGAEQLEGSRATIRGSVDYTGRYFIKNVHDPYNQLVAFAWPQDAPPRQARGAEQTEIHLRGRKYPVRYVHEFRTASGVLQMWLHDGDEEVPPVHERHATLEALVDERPTVCILFSVPAESVFADIVGDADLGIVPYGVEGKYDRDPKIVYGATNYSEDFYERGGL